MRWYNKTMISSTRIYWHQIVVHQQVCHDQNLPRHRNHHKVVRAMPVFSWKSSFTASLSFLLHTSTTTKRHSRLSERLVSLSLHDCTAVKAWAPLQDLSIVYLSILSACRKSARLPNPLQRKSLSSYLSVSRLLVVHLVERQEDDCDVLSGYKNTLETLLEGVALCPCKLLSSLKSLQEPGCTYCYHSSWTVLCSACIS
jgi:hypothetical protein